MKAGFTNPISFNGIISNFSLIMFGFPTHRCLPRTYSNWFSVSLKCEFILLVTVLNEGSMGFLFIVLRMPNKLIVATYLLVIHLSPFIASYLRSFA